MKLIIKLLLQLEDLMSEKGETVRTVLSSQLSTHLSIDNSIEKFEFKLITDSFETKANKWIINLCSDLLFYCNN